ncbi:hypothetical protein ATANTOWER_028860 [Ataeniobius toweri]|uniref:Uncharacterized protein n=1 Tax=Ataeniobius toweri TaxID=208326 RepID=A0ABU7AC57_9TELE|nr:hypothetical protein [Ataeniobius toweri]
MNGVNCCENLEMWDLKGGVLYLLSSFAIFAIILAFNFIFSFSFSLHRSYILPDVLFSCDTVLEGEHQLGYSCKQLSFPSIDDSLVPAFCVEPCLSTRHSHSLSLYN